MWPIPSGHHGGIDGSQLGFTEASRGPLPGRYDRGALRILEQEVTKRTKDLGWGKTALDDLLVVPPFTDRLPQMAPIPVEAHRPLCFLRSHQQWLAVLIG
jgi:hypothetical protein